MADILIRPKPGKDFELPRALCALIRGRSIRARIAETTGVPLETLRDLTERRLPVCVCYPIVIPAKARLQDVGGRAASGTSCRVIQESRAEG